MRGPYRQHVVLPKALFPEQADAGIRCHLCRQFVEGYDSMDTRCGSMTRFPRPPTPLHPEALWNRTDRVLGVCSAARQCQAQVNAFLVGANKAATAAAQARKPAPKKSRPVRTCCLP